MRNRFNVQEDYSNPKISYNNPKDYRSYKVSYNILTHRFKSGQLSSQEDDPKVFYFLKFS
jgi:hypothetical protein